LRNTRRSGRAMKRRIRRAQRAGEKLGRMARPAAEMRPVVPPPDVARAVRRDGRRAASLRRTRSAKV